MKNAATEEIQKKKRGGGEDEKIQIEKYLFINNKVNKEIIYKIKINTQKSSTNKIWVMLCIL